MQAADAAIEKKNAELRMVALTMCGGAFGAAIVTTVCQVLLFHFLQSKGRTQFVNETPQNMVYAAVIAAMYSCPNSSL